MARPASWSEMMDQGVRLHRVTMRLARNKDFPEGSPSHGYSLVAPLNADWRLDAEAWRTHRGECVVRRFAKNEETAQGRLVHRPGGAGGATWTFDYDASSDFDDEAGHRLGDHRFKPGEYVSVRDPEGQPHTYRIDTVSAI